MPKALCELIKTKICVNVERGQFVSKMFQVIFVVYRYNVCIMAYGQTGSGKTHTMLGSHDLDMEIDSESLNKDEGIIPRSAKELFR